MPTAATVAVRAARILGKIVVALVWTISQLVMTLYRSFCNKFSEEAEEDDEEVTTGLRPVVKTKVTPSLCLREVKPLDLDTLDGPKPLVVFFPWLMASKKQVDRYAELYHQRGWDVLTVQGQMKHFLWPPKALAVAQEVVTYLTHNEAQVKRPLVSHATSIGAYMYTVFVMELQKRPKTFEKMKSRFKGQVFDSIVMGGLERMGNGIAKSYATNSIVRVLITTSVKLYMKMTRQYTVDFYDLAVATFYENPIGCPSLFFYSHNDPMSDSKALEAMLHQWKTSRNDDVTTKSWTSSPHAGHLRANKEEYLETLDTFILKIKQ